MYAFFSFYFNLWLFLLNWPVSLFRCLQDIWRTFEENPSKQPIHYIWHKSIVWFHWWIDWSELPIVCISLVISYTFVVSFVRMANSFPPYRIFEHYIAIRSIVIDLVISQIVIFSLEKDSCTYVPKNKEWIKEQIYNMLRRQAGKWMVVWGCG